MFFDVYVLDHYVLKLLRLETITFSDATLSEINVVLCYVLSQYRPWMYTGESDKFEVAFVAIFRISKWFQGASRTLYVFFSKAGRETSRNIIFIFLFKKKA